MNFYDLIKNRYSVRSYKPQPVEKEKLERVLNAARLAPTAANRQSFQLIIIETARYKTALRQIYSRDWLVEAPLVICACAIPSGNWVRSDGKNYSDVDVTIVMDHLILAATEEGLGTCWIAAFDAKAAKELLNLPEGMEPVLLTPLGYPNSQPPVKKRKSLEDVVKYI